MPLQNNAGASNDNFPDNLKYLLDVRDGRSHFEEGLYIEPLAKIKFIDTCYCAPHPSLMLGPQNVEFDQQGEGSGDGQFSISGPENNLLSLTEGCNGPIHGIETHPQGLKCWTCGEKSDAIDCSGFLREYMMDEHKGDKFEESGTEDNKHAHPDGRHHVISASSETTVTNAYYNDRWSKPCLKDDKLCTFQVIVDQHGNKRKLQNIIHHCLFILKHHIPVSQGMVFDLYNILQQASLTSMCLNMMANILIGISLSLMSTNAHYHVRYFLYFFKLYRPQPTHMCT